jgi:hypothetical protein
MNWIKLQDITLTGALGMNSNGTLVVDLSSIVSLRITNQNTCYLTMDGVPESPSSDGIGNPIEVVLTPEQITQIRSTASLAVDRNIFINPSKVVSLMRAEDRYSTGEFTVLVANIGRHRITQKNPESYQWAEALFTQTM